MRRYLYLTYGLFNYVLFLGVSLYLAGFLLNIVPRGIDRPVIDPIWLAVLVDALLVGVFGVQHSVMARAGFKRWWMTWVPEPIERSTYVLCTNLALMLLVWQWRPLGGVIWSIEQPLFYALLVGAFLTGWLIVVGSSHLINHFELFGVRQVWNYFRRRPNPPVDFVTPGPYRWIRHPLYVGWLIVFWATPTMTIAHLLIALGMTFYMLFAIPWEERDLIRHYGDLYVQYRRRTPALIPRLVLRQRQAGPVEVVSSDSGPGRPAGQSR